MAIRATVDGILWKEASTFTFGKEGKVAINFPLLSSPSNSWMLEDGGEATFVDATMWRGSEKFAQNFPKGTKISLVGEIEHTKDNQKYNMKMTVSDILVYDNGSGSSSSSQEPERQVEDMGGLHDKGNPEAGSNRSGDPFGTSSQIDISDDDIPF